MLVGCGGDANYDSTDGQFANEPAGNYDAEITRAYLKPKQMVAQTNDLLLSVENTGDKTIPALALTVRLVGEDSTLPFAYRDEQTGLASPQRPVWVMEEGYPKLAGTVGQGGTGIQTAPAQAAAAAALALGEPLPTDLLRHGISAAALGPARLRTG